MESERYIKFNFFRFNKKVIYNPTLKFIGLLHMHERLMHSCKIGASLIFKVLRVHVY